MAMKREKCGYMDIKLPAKNRGIYFKAWKRRWVCLHHMADITNNKIVAILNLWPSKELAETRRQDKMTIYIENVTKIRRTKSKTHAHALEIIEEEPVLYMAGESETCVQSWKSAFRRIFWPRQTQLKQLLPPGWFEVAVIDNDDSEKHSLFGAFLLSVSPEGLCLHSIPDKHVTVRWPLDTIMRFIVGKGQTPVDANKILVIIAGPNSPTAQSKFIFFSEDAPRILKSIHHSITFTLKQKERLSIDSLDLSDSNHPRAGRTESNLSRFSCPHISITALESQQTDQEFFDRLDPFSCSVRSMPVNFGTDDAATAPRLNSFICAPKDRTSTIGQSPPSSPHEELQPSYRNRTRSTPRPLVRDQHPQTVSATQVTDPELNDGYDTLNFGKRRGIETLDSTDLMLTPSEDTHKSECFGNNLLNKDATESDISPVMDDCGYAHIGIGVNSEGEPGKDRTFSTSSAVSQVSVASRDSGVGVFVLDNSPSCSPINRHYLSESNARTNSFDSAVASTGKPDMEDVAEIPDFETPVEQSLPSMSPIDTLGSADLHRRRAASLPDKDMRQICRPACRRRVSSGDDSSALDRPPLELSGTPPIHSKGELLEQDEYPPDIGSWGVGRRRSTKDSLYEDIEKFLRTRPNAIPSISLTEESTTNLTSDHLKADGRKMSLKEALYEDLDIFRKDLNKFLGVPGNIDIEAPPALPERPKSLSLQKSVSFDGDSRPRRGNEPNMQHQRSKSQDRCSKKHFPRTPSEDSLFHKIAQKFPSQRKSKNIPSNFPMQLNPDSSVFTNLKRSSRIAQNELYDNIHIEPPNIKSRVSLLATQSYSIEESSDEEISNSGPDTTSVQLVDISPIPPGKTMTAPFQPATQVAWTGMSHKCSLQLPFTGNFGICSDKTFDSASNEEQINKSSEIGSPEAERELLDLLGIGPIDSSPHEHKNTQCNTTSEQVNLSVDKNNEFHSKSNKRNDSGSAGIWADFSVFGDDNFPKVTRPPHKGLNAGNSDISSLTGELGSQMDETFDQMSHERKREPSFCVSDIVDKGNYLKMSKKRVMEKKTDNVHDELYMTMTGVRWPTCQMTGVYLPTCQMTGADSPSCQLSSTSSSDDGSDDYMDMSSLGIASSDTHEVYV